ncbi:hypothetical protein [Comamonas sp. C11]|uniref:hypothetical protein n=1 Tax=Comamonas sp. C11 TaxID=2966554 RepID=UPI002111D6C2|nr:hypothetical protein [Comamonas sp. C11]UUC95459.1 hypothetical protein NOX35_09280 [Comamonas sp. C11]
MSSFEQQITELTLKREINKRELFEKEALRLRNKERFLVYGEHTDIKERVALDSEIACLEADRQRTKVELMKLKLIAKERRTTSLVVLLCDALAAHGLKHEITAASEKATEMLREEGLIDAYRSNLGV